MTARASTFIAVTAVASCSLTTDLTGFIGGADPDPDGGPPGESGATDVSAGPASRIYVAGGVDPAELDTVLSAPIAEDGSLGAWRAEPTLPKQRNYAPSFVSGDSWYLVGGDVFPGTSNTVVRGRLESARLLSWEPAAPFATARVRHGAALSPRGFVYVTAGTDSIDQTIATIEVAPITAQGIGGFRATAPLPAPRTRVAAAASNRRVYVVSGTSNETGSRVPEIYSARIEDDGSLLSWTVAATLTPPREHMRANIVGEHLLITGGSGAPREVVVADLDGDGAITSQRQTTPLPFDRLLHTVVLARGFAYVIGGMESGAPKADVVFAPVAGDASVGSWRTTTPLPSPRAYHAAAAY